jgi:hypothetical protein
VVRDQHFSHSQLRKPEIGVMRTHEVRVHNSIAFVDKRRDLDHRSGPKNFASSEIQELREGRKPLLKFMKCKVSIHEGD